MLSAETSNVLAICMLAFIGLAMTGGIVVKLRRSPFTPIQSLLYAINYVITRVLWRTQALGSLPVAANRGAVIVCNHRCPLDPGIVFVAVPRAVHWMVAREYCEHPALRWILKTCEVIPTGRGGVDTASTRMAIRLAASGELVALFPEGRINTGQDLLLPGRPGAALIALKARVPMIPCYIEGAPYDGTTLGCLLMPAAVRLTFGDPIDLSAYYGREGERETLENLTRQFLREIAKLAGDFDFRPQLAGRVYKPND